MNLINWPVADERPYRDTDEGGMFAYLIVADIFDDEHGEMEVDIACMVDVYTHLSAPDVCLSPEGRELWASGAERHDEYQTASDIYHFLTEHNAPDELTSWPLKNTKLETSQALWNATFLGSTSASLYDDAKYSYFTAGHDHLTHDGHVLFDLLHQAYGRRPRILTFLDT